MKIAIDAMGGDHGLTPVVEGAIQAIKELDIESIADNSDAKNGASTKSAVS